MGQHPLAKLAVEDWKFRVAGLCGVAVAAAAMFGLRPYFGEQAFAVGLGCGLVVTVAILVRWL